MCSAPGIRQELHQQGRDIIEEFSPDELMYRRFKEAVPPKPWEENSVPTNVFSLSDDSCNRSSLSEPEDVLLNVKATSIEDHFLNWGIASLSCAFLLEKEFPLKDSKPQKKYQVKPEHKPIDCMYPHSELIIYDCTTKDIIPDRPKSIKAAVRLFLHETMTVIKQPDA